jgi:hypothetical protein
MAHDFKLTAIIVAALIALRGTIAVAMIGFSWLADVAKHGSSGETAEN